MLHATGATSAHPFGDARVVKRDARAADDRREAFPDSEHARMLAVAAPIDLVLILLGARGGLRLAAALALRWADVRLRDSLPTLLVRHGKGGTERRVALTPEPEALLTQFTDDEIETGVIARGRTAVGAADRHTAAALKDRLADAVHDDRSTSQSA